MKVSVIVPTHSLDRFKDTLEAIKSVLDQTYTNREVIVVVDRNVDLLTRLISVVPSEVSVIPSNGLGLSEARNTGLHFARGEVVAFIDDDAVADRDWLTNIVYNYRYSDVIGVGGPIRPLWLDNRSPPIPQELFWLIGCTYSGHTERRCSVRNTFGSNTSFRYKVFESYRFSPEIGRTDNKQLTSDDTEFSIRVLKNNPDSRIIFEPKAVVYHRIYAYRLSLGYILRRAYGEGFSKSLVARLHNPQVLSTESKYLKHVLMEFIPEQIKAMLKRQSSSYNIGRVVIVLLVISIVIIGYARGMLTVLNRKKLWRRLVLDFKS